MCLCLTNSNCVRVSHLVPGPAQADAKRGAEGGREIKNKRKMEDACEETKREQRRDKKEEGIYFCGYELFRRLQEAATLLALLCSCVFNSDFFGGIFSLELQYDLIFHGLVMFHDPKTR